MSKLVRLFTFVILAHIFLPRGATAGCSLVGSPVTPVSTIPAAGATNFQITYFFGGACSWSLQGPPEVHFSAPISGVSSGAQTITFSVDNNRSGAARSGTIKLLLNGVDWFDWTYTQNFLNGSAGPANLAAISGDSQVGLFWSPVTGASSYVVYGSFVSAFTPKDATIMQVVGANSALLTNLVNDSTYYFIVTAVSGQGESDPSTQISGNPVLPNSNLPTGLQATVDDRQTTLSWNAVATANKYRVYGSTNPVITPTNASIHLTTNQTQQLVTGLTDSVQYYFAISAISGSNESGLSSEVSVTPWDPYLVRAEPNFQPLWIQAGPIPAEGVTSSTISYLLNGLVPWQIAGPSFVTFAGLQSDIGAGPLPVNFSIGPNTTSSPRSGTITLYIENPPTWPAPVVAYVWNFTQNGATDNSLVITSTSFPQGIIGQAYSAQLAATGGITPYTWSISSGTLPAGIAISTSGLISGTPTLIGTSTFIVQAQDSLSNLSTATLTINVVSATLTPFNISCSPTMGPTQTGVFYSATCTGVGGVPIYMWGFSAGALPTGLSLTPSTGTIVTISGIPTSTGPYSYTLGAFDSEEIAVTRFQTFSGIISSATILTASPSSLTFNQVLMGPAPASISLTINSANPSSGVPVFISSETGSCAWLSFLTSGSFNTPETFSFTADSTGLSMSTGTYVCAVAFSGGGASTAVPFTFTLQPITPLVITSTSVPQAVLGQPYSVNLTATGGVPPYQWAFGSSPEVPGLIISPAGVLSGTPVSAGAFMFTASVFDFGLEQRTNQSLTLIVNLSSAPAAPVVPVIEGFDPAIPSIVDRSATFHLNVAGSWTEIDWTFTSTAGGPAPGSQSGSLGVQTNGESYTAPTHSASLGLSILPLISGPQRLTVIVHNGSAAASISADFTLVSSDLSAVKVHPSPWRSDLHSGHDLTFDNLPVGSTVKIFTVSGRWVKTLSNASGQIGWDLKNDDGSLVASGIYIYLVTDPEGNKAHGKFGVIR